MATTGVFEDLNDLHWFAAVVEQRGFSAAERELGVSKSKLSKRVAMLEERLGVRLLQRTTRKFVVTDTGKRFYQHCRAVLDEAKAAQEAIEAEQAEPRGLVKISCPVFLAQSLLAPLLPEFMARYPQVNVRLLATNRAVDLLDEGVDIAIRVRNQTDTDASFILREFGRSRVILVASPSLWEQYKLPTSPSELAFLPVLTMQEQQQQTWHLVDTQGKWVDVSVFPRLICGEFSVLLEAACRGVGVALLPQPVCIEALNDGRLAHVLPDWSGPVGMMHFVYPSRRGLLPGVRALVDFLADNMSG